MFLFDVCDLLLPDWRSIYALSGCEDPVNCQPLNSFGSFLVVLLMCIGRGFPWTHRFWFAWPAEFFQEPGLKSSTWPKKSNHWHFARNAEWGRCERWCVCVLDGLIWGGKANHITRYNNKPYDYVVHAETISHNVPSFREEPMFMPKLAQAERARQRAHLCLDPELNGQGRKWRCNTHLNFLSLFEISNMSLFLIKISTFSLLFYWNLYVLMDFSWLFQWVLYFLITFLLKSLLSLYFSIEIRTFSLLFCSNHYTFSLFYWNLYFLLSCSLFYWNLYFLCTSALYFRFAQLVTFKLPHCPTPATQTATSWHSYLMTELFNWLSYLLTKLVNWLSYVLIERLN